MNGIWFMDFLRNLFLNWEAPIPLMGVPFTPDDMDGGYVRKIVLIGSTGG
jgi:hypothetical protein